MAKSSGPDFNELARIARRNSSGSSEGGSSGSSGGGGSSGSGSAGGDETLGLKLGATPEFVQAVNSVAQAGTLAMMLGIMFIKGLDAVFQAFAIEATMRGGSLQGLTSSLSLAKPRQAVQGKSAAR
jgi:hypothetical protein